MTNESPFDTLQWYVVQTHPKQEDRAYRNLETWNVEVFYPRYQQRRQNEYSGASYATKPLFPRYIFARFKLRELYHKIRYTRGVHSLVSFNEYPTPVDDDIIGFIQARVKPDGLVKVEGDQKPSEDLKPGDEVIVERGPLANLRGVFERGTRDSDRVMILLQAVNYQAHIMIDRSMISASSGVTIDA